MHSLVRALGALVIGLLGLQASARAADSAEKRPNIIIICADDLGAMDVGFENPKSFYETPNLDRMAQQSVRFTRAYAANPVCSPTRYSILTGKYPTRAALTNWLPGVRVERFQPAPLAHHMALEEETIAESLRAAGYRTAHVGKWHLGESAEYWPEAQGFEINLGGYSAGAPANFFPPYKNPRLEDGPPGEHLSLRLADESAKLIEKFHQEGKPFLIVHADYAVHNPVQAPEAVVEKYRQKAKQLGLVDKIEQEDQYHVSAKTPRRVRAVQSHAAYAGLVEMMDTGVGRILAKLDELGIADNTIVIFTSDNGGLSTNEGDKGGGSSEGAPAEATPAAQPEKKRRGERAVSMPTSNLPLRAGKGWLYEGGVRVPLLVRWPLLKHGGSTVSEPVMTIDFKPTLLAAAQVKSTAVMDGRDIRPLLTGGAGWSKRALFWHYPHYSNQGGFPGGAILEDGWKLLENYEDGRVSLYRIDDDVGERKDLSAAEGERVKALRAKLHAWYQTVDAKFLSAVADGPQPWRP